MLFDDWRKILDQYEELAQKLYLIPHFCISGGEPTISPMFPLFLAELHSRWPKADIAVLTNGTAISDKIVADLVRYKADVQISIDGPDSERHNRIRGAGNFEKSIKGLKMLQNAGLSTTFQTVLSNRTAPWIQNFFETAHRMGAIAMNFTRFVPQGKGELLRNSGGDRPLAGPELCDAYRILLLCP